jgi:hypothetical protein
MLMSERPELTALTWPDGRPKVAPVQGYAQGIPWSLHLKAYNAYCKEYGSQEALIDLAGRGCRGGFGVNELDRFVPGWRDEVEELPRLKAQIEQLQQEVIGEREARQKLETAYRKQDAAMGVLWERLTAAGVDCSDLIP